jgi:alkyl hydroperoxide reductase subunit AhpC
LQSQSPSGTVSYGEGLETIELNKIGDDDIEILGKIGTTFEQFPRATVRLFFIIISALLVRYCLYNKLELIYIYIR